MVDEKQMLATVYVNRFASLRELYLIYLNSKAVSVIREICGALWLEWIDPSTKMFTKAIMKIRWRRKCDKILSECSFVEDAADYFSMLYLHLTESLHHCDANTWIGFLKCKKFSRLHTIMRLFHHHLMN